MKIINTPIPEELIAGLEIGDQIYITGTILTGRDAVLPRIVEMISDGSIEEIPVQLRGGVMFHSAVSPAGVGPTSSNKPEIENSIIPLSEAGIKIHIGKGALKKDTVKALAEKNSVFAVTPPVTALLKSKILKQSVLAFSDEGMEAMHRLEVLEFPAIVVAAKGKSIF